MLSWCMIKRGMLIWKVWDIVMVQFSLIFQADSDHLLMLPTVAEKQKLFDLSVTPEILEEVMGTLL